MRDRIAIDTATDALLRADLELAGQVVGMGREIDMLRNGCEHAAVTLLALQAPVAGELRRIVTAIELLGDLDRMAVLAEHIAELARRRFPANAVPESVQPIVSRMGAEAVAIAAAAAEVLGSRDPHAAALLDAQDDTMDRLHHDLLTVVLATDGSFDSVTTVDLTLLGRYYERFADHAVLIGRRVFFMVTGEYPDHRTTAESS